MQKALHTRTTVQPGGKVEFASLELDAGQTADVVPSPINYPSSTAWGGRGDLATPR